MTTNLNRASATIYQFPVGGRAGLAGHREAVNPPAQRANEIATSGAWYHEEAIRDAELTRKN